MPRTNWQTRNIKFRHFRILENADTVSSHGGATVAYTESGDGRFHAAAAFCNPMDNFQYGYGRDKAAGRLTQMILTGREADYDKYFSSHEGESLPEFLDTLSHHMTEGLGYVYPRKKN